MTCDKITDTIVLTVTVCHALSPSASQTRLGTKAAEAGAVLAPLPPRSQMKKRRSGGAHRCARLSCNSTTSKAGVQTRVRLPQTATHLVTRRSGQQASGAEGAPLDSQCHFDQVTLTPRTPETVPGKAHRAARTPSEPVQPRPL